MRQHPGEEKFVVVVLSLSLSLSLSLCNLLHNHKPGTQCSPPSYPAPQTNSRALPRNEEDLYQSPSKRFFTDISILIRILIPIQIRVLVLIRILVY